jgi:DNA-3-methyladenine glycosylase I
VSGGKPQHDDRVLFEFLLLEGAQAGLSWDTILQKRENYRAAFDGFDPERVAGYDRRKTQSLLRNPGIVRNRLKVASSVKNAKAFLNVQRKFGSFDRYIWQVVGGKPKVNKWRSIHQLPASTSESDAMSKDLKKTRVQLRGIDHLLCLHASRRPGKRPPGRVLPICALKQVWGGHSCPPLLI